MTEFYTVKFVGSGDDLYVGEDDGTGVYARLLGNYGDFFVEPPASNGCVDVAVQKLDIAMDGNRDESIDFDGTNDNHCLFWVNDDHDCLH